MKRVCNLPTLLPKQWSHINDDTFLQLVAQPSLQNMLIVQRLTFLQRQIYQTNPLVRGMLMHDGPGGFWQQWYKDLAEAQHRIPHLASLPTPNAASRSQWTTYICITQADWPKQLKKYLTPPVPPSN
eukprot:4144763-Amphidinium_carterae.1